VHPTEDSGDDTADGDSWTGSDVNLPPLTGTIHRLPGTRKCFAGGSEQNARGVWFSTPLLYHIPIVKDSGSLAVAYVSRPPYSNLQTSEAKRSGLPIIWSVLRELLITYKVRRVVLCRKKSLPQSLHKKSAISFGNRYGTVFLGRAGCASLMAHPSGAFNGTGFVLRSSPRRKH
jgi:hypothetical protein